MRQKWTNKGLTPSAEAMLNNRVRVGIQETTTRYDNGEVVQTKQDLFDYDHEKEVYETDEPWFGQSLPLHLVKFKDGRTLETFIQDSRWKNGPITYLALRDHRTKEPVPETLWSPDQIEGQ